MNKSVKELFELSNSNQIKFVENYFISNDNLTIMGEIEIKYLLFIPYRETEAGSNPREYYGLKKSNLEILKSMLSHRESFRFLHSGVIVSAIGVNRDNDERTITYTDACLTNGNQTRFLFLIISYLLAYKDSFGSLNINKKKFELFITRNFKDSLAFENIISRLSFAKINQVLRFLAQNTKYLKLVERMNFDEFLKMKIRIQINLINAIIEFSNIGDEYSLGTLIAEANNDTQNVKKDDIFGNKYKTALEKYVFKDFNRLYNKKIKIEYRQGEIEDSDKVHILTLLRPVVSIGLLTRENQIFNYSNQREPIYRLFEKLLKSKKAAKTIDIVSKTIPFLYKIRNEYLAESLEKHRRNCISDYIKKGINGDLDSSIIGSKIKKSNYDQRLIEKEVKSLTRYNIEHIAPVLFYRIRNLLKITDDGKNITIDLDTDNLKKLIDGLSEAIYKKYIEDKFSGLPTSLTTLVRSSEFFKYGEEAYSAFKSLFDLKETDFVLDNRYLVIK